MLDPTTRFWFPASWGVSSDVLIHEGNYKWCIMLLNLVELLGFVYNQSIVQISRRFVDTDMQANM